MARQLEWTRDTLKDVTTALDTSMGKVTRETLSQTAVLENWDKVQTWLDQVKNVPPGAGNPQPTAIPAFPLTGRELRALQDSVDRIARAQAAASPTLSGPAPLHLFESLTHLRWTSAILLAVIICSCAASFVDLMWLRDSYEYVLLTINVILGLLGILVWASHFVRLSHHAALLHRMHTLKF